MSVTDFYEHKADQCLRMAAATSDAKQRTRLQEEAVLWREIRSDVIKQERASKSP
jgi:hypothetical protein